MQIISQFAPLPLAQPEKGTAVAMGYFDGIHIGHRAVIEGAVQWAKTHDAAPAVFTFRLPVENKMKGKRLLSTEDKHALIHSLGVEYYLAPDFEAIKALSPEEFVRGIVENCHARALFCGENFTFGAKAAGTPELLRHPLSPLVGVEVVVVPMAQFEGKAGVLYPHPHRAGGRGHPGRQRYAGHALRHPLCGAARGRTGAHPRGAHHSTELYPQGFQMPRSGIYYHPHLHQRGVVSSATGLGSRPGP